MTEARFRLESLGLKMTRWKGYWEEEDNRLCGGETGACLGEMLELERGRK